MNHYRVKSLVPFTGANQIKTMHAVLSHFFESCLDGWHKGDQYPNFKIVEICRNELYLTSDLSFNCNAFNYVFSGKDGAIIKNVVEPEFLAEQTSNLFSKDDTVRVDGAMSLLKNVKGANGKRSKISYVRSEYERTGFVKNIDEFCGKLEQLTGIDINKASLKVSPIYVDRTIVSNKKQINSAFGISFVGRVNNQHKSNSLLYTSVGNDRGYGFGALNIAKAPNHE